MYPKKEKINMTGDGKYLKGLYNKMIEVLELSPTKLNDYIEEHIRYTRSPTIGTGAVNTDAGNVARALREPEITWKTWMRVIRSVRCIQMDIDITLHFEKGKSRRIYLEAPLGKPPGFIQKVSKCPMEDEKNE